MLQEETTPFTSVILYESHGGCDARNINPRTSAIDFDGLETTEDPFLREMRAVMIAWDEDVLRDCDESCAEAEAGRDAGDARAAEAWRRNDACRTEGELWEAVCSGGPCVGRGFG